MMVLASLRYYRGVHAMVVAGVAVAVAVLAGALVVGASVRDSLRDLALSRLGHTHLVVSAPGFFRNELAEELDRTSAPLIALTGAVVHEPTGRTAARVQVFGIDDRFMRVHGLGGDAPRGADAWIGEPLAAELQAQPGDRLLLRVAKPSDIPLSSVQGRRDEAGERVRVTIARIASRSALGEFSLAPSQGPALTIFVSVEQLQRDLQVDGRANTLVLGNAADVTATRQQLHAIAQLEDYGLRLRPSATAQTLVIESRAGVIRPALSQAIVDAAGKSGINAEPVLVHLANVIRIGTREIPYSLVAGRALHPGADSSEPRQRRPKRSNGAIVRPDRGFGSARQSSTQVNRGDNVSSGGKPGTPPPLVLNEWAAADLGASPSDRVTLDYFVWSDEGGLETRSAEFSVAGIEPMTGDGGDPTFAPQYPGLTDAKDVSAWDPPFPIDLKRVRKQDEAYWDTWHTSPKAFVLLETAQRLWGTVHGDVSSVRLAVPAGVTRDAFADRVRQAVRAQLDPASSGFAVRDARADALAAAEGTTDFAEYFFYFSFFLVVAGLLLAALFFALGIEQRHREIGLLAATGFTRSNIARLLIAEAGVLALAGSLIGAAGAIAYAALIMHGLRTWWVDAVGTTALTLHIDWRLVAGGAAAACLAALGALAWSLRTALARTPRALLGGPADPSSRDTRGTRALSLIGIASGAVALALVMAARLQWISDAGGFFGAGAACMIGGLATFGWWLRRRPRAAARPTGVVSVAGFGAGYTRWRPTRSVLSASLITFACFVIVAVGAFRRDPSGLSLARELGTGGFVLMAESVASLLHNPNTTAGRDDLALPDDPLLDRMRVSRFRLKPGDEASCLTLYQPRNPRVIAPEDSFLTDRRFTFAQSLASTPEEHANPWLLLKRRFDDGAIAAVADQTSLTYVFHLKVGDDYVFTPDGGSPTRLRIVGALADSVFQSELIVGEASFVTLFPRREGYGLWMIDAPPADAPPLATLLEDRLADYGVDVIDTRARLAAYHRVENTYLSTFQALGGLGLLVGTFGLAAVLARNVLERRRELGLLRAIGFTPGELRTLVLSESMVLVGVGLMLGLTAALVAVVPALAARAAPVPVGGFALLLGAVTTAAGISSLLAARLASSTSVAAALKNE